MNLAQYLVFLFLQIPKKFLLIILLIVIVIGIHDKIMHMKLKEEN